MNSKSKLFSMLADIGEKPNGVELSPKSPLVRQLEKKGYISGRSAMAPGRSVYVTTTKGKAKTGALSSASTAKVPAKKKLKQQALKVKAESASAMPLAGSSEMSVGLDATKALAQSQAPKIIQIATLASSVPDQPVIHALADDGSVWNWNWNSDQWFWISRGLPSAG